MSEIPKAYEPQAVEDKWYQFWLDGKFFVADAKSPKPAYSIVIPPPNVTGVLTLGHVLNNTIQDILARKARMDGREVLWLPGTDHAGIATQTVVERALKKSGEIKRRDDLGREEFLKRVWQWKEKHGGIIIQQLKKLGASCDWSRERFTMDADYSRCVQKVFVELYKKERIYRGKRMVNWCPATQTALSDEEVIMKEQRGSLYYFKVEVVGQASSLSQTGKNENGDRQDACPTFLTIATTRPETISGDTAVAVNPKDPRYAHLIGKHVIRPLPAELPREQKLIPIIGDERVDFEFGTGVLKVTPAHDKADFEIYNRATARNLQENFAHPFVHPPIEVIGPDGKMTENAGADLAGLDRFQARKIAAEKLAELGLLEKEEPYTNNVGFSERADVPIEPRLSEQWFLKYPSAEEARDCVAQIEKESAFGGKYPPETHFAGASEKLGNRPAPNAQHTDDASSLVAHRHVSADMLFQTTPSATESSSASVTETRITAGEKMQFHPQRWAKVYDHWMSGLQDWCISRQLWWGHRIPVWRLPDDEETKDKLLGALAYLKELKNSKRTDFAIHAPKTGKTSIGDRGQTLSVISIQVAVAPEAGDISKKLESFGFVQDPDVLDTWFSSWLWPFATMGWTGDAKKDSQNETLKKFYPTADLVTGPDIIFFWVARMIMAGYEFMGQMPFRNVYFTGIIRDKLGRKMSKSLGNSPDPLDLIAKYGADALRFGVMRAAPLGQDILFDEQNVELGRNFCNKLWNACRFRQMQGGGDAPSPNRVGQASSLSPSDRQDAYPTPVVRQASSLSQGDASRNRDGGVAATYEVQGEIDPQLLTPDDKWILLKLDTALREVAAAFADYKFSDATATLYRFFWSEYCDWYLEAGKAALRPVEELKRESVEAADPSTLQPFNPSTAQKANTLAVMDFVLSHTLRLFHPFLPFITEELWHGMGYSQDMPENQGGRTIMFAPWPKPLDDDFKSHYGLSERDEKFIESRNELIVQGRDLRRQANIPASKKVKFIFKPAGPPGDVEVLKLLLNAEAVEVNPNFQPGKNTLSIRHEQGELFLPLEGLVDVEAEKARLKKEMEKIESEIAKVEQKLANPNFAQKVPATVLDEHKKRLADWQSRREHVRAALASLGQ